MWFFSNKVKVRESGLLEEFRDCHCHLLPGVDDGVDEITETLDILDIWESQGVKEIWLTPHVMEDIPNTPERLKEGFKNLKRLYTGHIQLHLATENMLDGLFMERLEDDCLLTLGTNRKRLLVETSYFTPPMHMEQMIEHIKEKGYEPVLAHPERYHYMLPYDYEQWKCKDVMLQLNVTSLVGAYGPQVKRKAEKLLALGMYDYIGTDTHSLHQATFFLNSLISKKTLKTLRDIAESQEL